MEIEELYKIFTEYPHVTTDTRNCPKDSIFFALKGANFNGNEYAHKALESGCSYAVVDEEQYAVEGAENIILVDDCLKTLQELAHFHRQQFRIPVIGITGTNGKTTTKELVASVLSQEYNVLFTQGNLNNHIGVPLTLLQINKKHEVAIIEMGASHVGEIAILAEIADPNFGLITNLGRAHLEGFGSYENIIKTKGELYEYIKYRKDGKIFIDHDNATLQSISDDNMTKIEYGNNPDLFVSGKIVSEEGLYLSFEWRFSQNTHLVHSHLIGDYNISNVLAAVTIGKYFGVKSSLVCKALSEYIPNNNRSQLKETQKNHLIVDAYNANPTSMLAALQNFHHMNVSKKALVLGDMRELGDNSKVEHQKIVDYIRENNFREVFLIGQSFKDTENTFSCFDKVSDFNDYITSNPLEDHYILIKGSRGLELEKCIDIL